MKIISKTKGMINKFSGMTRKMMRKKSNVPFDKMQKYMTIDEYNVGAPEGIPHGEEYKLIVYKNTDNVLHQALCSVNVSNLAPTYVRKFDKRLNRYAAFVNKRTGRRYIAEDQLDQLVDYVKKHGRKGYNSINIGVLTDIHYKDTDSIDFCGYNGLRHVKEFNYFEDKGILDLKAHLGDWTDGSDPGLVGEAELISLSRTFRSKKTNFAVIKGNHDESDKFDEHHDLRADSPENELEGIMWPSMYAQDGIHYITRKHDAVYFDKDDVRITIVNTSNLPYELDDQGKKKYDMKLSLAICEDQMQKIIEILENSNGKTVISMSHANPITRKGTNALKFNGRSLHKLMVAFNQHEKGYLSSRGVPPESTLANSSDFTKIKNTKIVAYFCGHRHTEDQYRINGIQYIFFNCPVLMRPNHVFTTQHNKRWNKQMGHANEAAGYIVNVDTKRHLLQVFGYGAASKRRFYRI